LLYIVSFWFYLQGFRKREYTQRRTTGILGAAVVLHTVLLVLISMKTGHLPLAGVFIVISVFAYLLAVLYLLIEYTIRERSFGIFVLPFVTGLQILASLAMDFSKPFPEVLQNLFFEVHVLSMLIGYAGFALSFIASIMYIILFHEIQSKHLGYYYSRLPSLKFLDIFSTRTVTIGLIFMTTGILMGVYNSWQVWQTLWPRDPKMTAVLINWLIYAFLLGARKGLSWEANKTSYVSIIGFISILISFIIVSSMFSDIHSF
jgi:ABC-type transport system involved in cytochrome c biogenesis permease subunit